MSLVSVIIPTRNRAHSIEKAIESVLSQNISDLEIIVIDDGSTDETKTLLTKLQAKDSRLKTIFHKKSQGAQSARNTGIKNSQSEWIAFLDSDDLWLPNSLTLRLQKANEGCFSVVHSACKILGDAQKQAYFSIPPMEGNIYKQILSRQGPMFQGLLVKRELLEKIGLLDETIVSYQEWDTAIRLAKHAPFGFVSEATFIYTPEGEDSISKSSTRAAKGYSQVFWKHYKEILRETGKETFGKHLLSISRMYGDGGRVIESVFYKVLKMVAPILL